MTRTITKTIVTIATYFAVEWEALYIDGVLIFQGEKVEHFHILPALAGIREIGRLEYRRCLANEDSRFGRDILDDFGGDFPKDIASLIATGLWQETVVDLDANATPSVSGFVVPEDDDDLNEPLGVACQLGDTECKSCQ